MTKVASTKEKVNTASTKIYKDAITFTIISTDSKCLCYYSAYKLMNISFK